MRIVIENVLRLQLIDGCYEPFCPLPLVGSA